MGKLRDHNGGGCITARKGSTAVLLLFPCCAAAWEIVPGITVAESWSSNLTLAPAGREVDDWITRIAPRVSLVNNGRRARVSLDYVMENLYYLGETQHNNTFHQAQASGSIELAQEWLFMDATAAYNQTLISAERPIPLSNLDVTQNQIDYATYSISPYVDHRFGTFARGELRYRQDVTDYKSGGIADGRAEHLIGAVSGGTRFEDFGWRLSYTERHLETDDGMDASLARGELRLSPQLSSRIWMDLVGGYEQNDYGDGQDDQEGEYWLAGLTWEPGSRTRIHAAGGERFYGTTANLELSHRTRRSQWQARYEEEFLNDIQGLAERPLTGGVEIPVASELTTEVYLRKRLGGSVTLETGRSTLFLNGYGERRNYQVSDQEERVAGGGARWSWAWSARTQTTLRLDYQQRRFRDSPREDELWHMRLELGHQILPRIRAGLDGSYVERDSTEPSAGYRQTVITLSANATF